MKDREAEVTNYVDDNLSIEQIMENINMNRFATFKILDGDTSIEWVLLNTSVAKELWRIHRNWSEFHGAYSSISSALYDAVEISWGRNASN